MKNIYFLSFPFSMTINSFLHLASIQILPGPIKAPPKHKLPTPISTSFQYLNFEHTPSSEIMASSPNKPSKSEDDSTKRLDREVRDLVSTLTDRLTKLHADTKVDSSIPDTKVDSSIPDTDVDYSEDDEHGIRILTLAGTNTGSTMRADLNDKLSDNSELPGAYANSNCQALNNSIMMNGSYTAEDPGIHIFVSEYDEEEHGKGKGKHTEKKREKQLQKTSEEEE